MDFLLVNVKLMYFNSFFKLYHLNLHVKLNKLHLLNELDINYENWSKTIVYSH